MYSETLTKDVHVEQLHWGGGTPTFLSMIEMQQLMKTLRSHTKFADNGEYSIEIDPRTVDTEIIAGLSELGFNRLSLGVQDFNTDVQRAVNRVQSEEQTLSVIEDARVNGFRSINIDLIYGLPKQTINGFDQTLDKVIQASPDRISLYSYAHLPQLFKTQRRINEAELPSSETKLQIMLLAIQRLTEAGYLYIGMDHFAKPDDDLAIAQQAGRLHRNFQGYSTHADCDLLAFGVSSIGAIGSSYYQNYRTIDEYYDCIDNNVLPIMRGIQLTNDDLIRRSVIQSLICNFNLSIEAIEMTHLIDFFKYFSEELDALKEFESDGLIHLKNNMISVTKSGRFLIRNICMIFDHYLQARDTLTRYSKVI